VVVKYTIFGFDVSIDKRKTFQHLRNNKADLCEWLVIVFDLRARVPRILIDQGEIGIIVFLVGKRR
jgi:hypothetical protein